MTKDQIKSAPDYDASDWITPETVADAIVHVLDVPPEATIPELVVKVAR